MKWTYVLPLSVFKHAIEVCVYLLHALVLSVLEASPDLEERDRLVYLVIVVWIPLPVWQPG